MKRTLLPQLLLLVIPVITFAQTSSQPSAALFVSDLNSKVTGTNATYFDLLRRIIPDLQVDANNADAAIGRKTIPIKRLSENTPPEALEGNIKLESFQPLWIKSDGRQVLLLDIDLSAGDANQGTPYEGETNLLAAFTVQPSVRLLDVMDVKTDRFSGFWETPSRFRLTAQSDAFLVNSSHSNAGESYNDLTVLFLNRDQFETITNIFLLDTQGCGANFTQSPSFRVLSGNTKYPGVLVTVKVKKEADSADCDRRTRGYVRSFQAVYQWNATKGEYQTTSRQLKALDKFNRDRL